MAILTSNDYTAAKKERILYKKTATVTAVAQMLQSIFNQAGLPGAGTLAGTNTVNGVVPTHLTAGFPAITPFEAGAKGYLWYANIWNDRASTLYLFDILFKAGAYAYNAGQTLSLQPAFSSRCPDYTGGASWGKGNQIILEQVTLGTGNQAVTVTYTNSDGVSGRTTGAVTASAALIAGRCIMLPLQAGDSGVQKIESVIGSVATVGTFNILVVRQILMDRVVGPGVGKALNLFETGMADMFQDMALAVYVRPDSTTSGVPEVIIEIANK